MRDCHRFFFLFSLALIVYIHFNFCLVRIFGKSDKSEHEKMTEFVEDRVFNDLRYTINNNKLQELGWTEVGKHKTNDPNRKSKSCCFRQYCATAWLRIRSMIDGGKNEPMVWRDLQNTLRGSCFSIPRAYCIGLMKMMETAWCFDAFSHSEITKFYERFASISSGIICSTCRMNVFCPNYGVFFS